MPFGNFQARAVFPEKVGEFVVRVDLVAEMAVFNPFDFFLEEDAEHYPFNYDYLTRKDLEPYLITEPVGPRLEAWLADFGKPRGQPLVNFLVDLNQRLADEIEYVIRMEPGVQTPDETLALALGSCRDSAWLLVQILRHLGIAARFVSGYLIQLKADQKALDGPSGTEQDFTDLHAWTEAYLPGAGWVGMDPTSGLLAGEGHIPLAATPHPSTAAPISGRVEPSECEFGFDMSVSRIFETPRVTKPYNDQPGRTSRAWAARSMPNSKPTTCASPWAASPRSWPSTTRRGRVEHRGHRPQQAAPGQRPDAAPGESASPPAACCTSPRANGIPASSCRAGH
jgi:transglutaminase-like putative cysteine protease